MFSQGGMMRAVIVGVWVIAMGVIAILVWLTHQPAPAVEHEAKVVVVQVPKVEPSKPKKLGIVCDPDGEVVLTGHLVPSRVGFDSHNCELDEKVIWHCYPKGCHVGEVP
jgi:multidrug efflux pump subunit AcrA (membrane-fusion protein)